jgi:hypothetical protein
MELIFTIFPCHIEPSEDPVTSIILSNKSPQKNTSLKPRCSNSPKHGLCISSMFSPSILAFNYCKACRGYYVVLRWIHSAILEDVFRNYRYQGHKRFLDVSYPEEYRNEASRSSNQNSPAPTLARSTEQTRTSPTVTHRESILSSTLTLYRNNKWLT